MKINNLLIKTMTQQQIIVQKKSNSKVRHTNWYQQVTTKQVKLTQMVTLQLQTRLQVQLLKKIKMLPISTNSKNNLKVMFMFTMQMSMVIRLKMMSLMKINNRSIKTTIQQQTIVLRLSQQLMVKFTNWCQKVTIQQVKLIHKVTGQAMMLQLVKLLKVIRTLLTSTNLKNNLKVMFMFTMQILKVRQSKHL